MEPCSKAFICLHQNDPDFHYEPNRLGKDDFLENWYVTMDLVCENPLTYLPMASYYFFGFGLGVVFFFTPDYLGRKKTIILFNSGYFFSVYILAYDQRVEMKKLGYFIQGLCHLKISTSYTHALELVPESYKSMVFTLILSFDATSILIASIFFKYVDPNETRLLEYHFYGGCASLVLYILFIPESPRWLFQKEGSKS